MSIETACKLVEDILSATDLSKERKIAQLKIIDQEQYKPLIRDLAYKKAPSELKDLTKVLEDLAYLSINFGDLSSNLQHYTDAAVFYQSVITTITEKINPDLSDAEYTDKIARIYKVLDVLSSKILSIGSIIRDGSAIFKHTHAESAENKKILSGLRKSVAVKMSVIEEHIYNSKTEDVKVQAKYQKQYMTESRKLFEEITESMKSFLAKLYSDAEKEMGQPPCKYTVIGLGSMALKQITPYSDLEFAILTENEAYKSSVNPKIREYFKNLSHLVNFKMITLGETVIPTSKYGVDLSHLVHRGINFDLGGKTSLGRIDKDKPYDLVQTVEKMLWYVHNEQEKASHIDKNLPYILEQVCYLYGNKNLVAKYKAGVSAFLHKHVSEGSQSGLLNYQDRALKLLNEGVVEINYMQNNASHLALRSKGNLEQFQPLSGNDGQLFDVKQEIYRLADRFLYSLGLYYGIQGESSWDTVERLYACRIINEQASMKL